MLILAINPTSGKGQARKRALLASDYFSTMGMRSRIIEGQTLDDFRGRFSQALNEESVSGVVAFGGDGFIHEVIQRLVPLQIPLGVIPCGTGNDFSRSLGINKLTFVQQLALIERGKLRTIDLGKVGQTWFAAILSSGFDALVNDRANEMRWPKGRMKYNLAMIEKLIQLKAHKYRLKIDDQKIEIEATLLTVANGSSYGGGMKVCPGAVIDDGLFDVMVLGKVSRIELLKVFPKVYSGRHVGHPAVTFYRGRQVDITGEGSSFADGERVASLPLTAECVTGALKVWA